MSSALNTKLSICNLALDAIKQRTIAALTDQNQQARVCNRWYDVVRRGVLRSADWTFARDQIVLNELGNQADAAANPVSDDADNISFQDVIPGWAFLFAYPSNNVIRINRVFNETMPGTAFPYTTGYPDYDADNFAYYDAFGRQNDFRILRSPVTRQLAIASQLQSASAEFTRDVTDESWFDDMFIQAFSMALATKIAIPLSADKQMFQLVQGELRAILGEAQGKSAGEDTERGPRYSNYEKARS